MTWTSLARMLTGVFVLLAAGSPQGWGRPSPSVAIGTGESATGRSGESASPTTQPSVGREAQGRPTTQPVTKMGQLAASMKPGDWAELVTAGIVEAHRATGASGAIFGYSEDGAWDPASLTWLYVGSDHEFRRGARRFVTYSALTNAWRVMPSAEWIDAGMGHGYDHNAINPAKGIFYHFPYGSGRRVVHAYDIAKGEWSDLPPLNPPEYLTVAAGVEYFPEMGGLFVANCQGGSAYLFKDETRQWVTLAKDLPKTSYHAFAEYSPMHKVMIFGGGGGGDPARLLLKCDADGKITRLKDAPFPLGVRNTIIVADPVSGDFLVFTRRGEFYVYDVAKDAWTRQEGEAPPIFSPTRVAEDKVWHVNATPVSNYGVVMFVKYYSASQSRAWVYLYKHREPKAPTPDR
jgi:hypothetical protein